MTKLTLKWHQKMKIMKNIFDLLKDIYYQMASRNLTDSGMSIAREKLLQVKKSHAKNSMKRDIKICENCKKKYYGNTFLYVKPFRS